VSERHRGRIGARLSGRLSRFLSILEGPHGGT